eukprot:gene522-998_t
MIFHISLLVLSLSSVVSLQPTRCNRNFISTSRKSSIQMASTLIAPIELTKDGGIKKVILTASQGRKIETGDILAIEYAASVKGGMMFAKGDQEQCIVKDGSLIKGWDIGISSMRVGEKARITLGPQYGYGAQGINPVIPPNAELEIDIRIQAWLGNQLRPETLFQKDLDIDPFISSTPEAIQSDFESMQSKKTPKEVGIVELYLTRLKNISFGFGGSNFFASQSGAKAPWYLTPNITFPTMITICLVAFLAVITSGAIREKGATRAMNADIISTINSPSVSENIFS